MYKAIFLDLDGTLLDDNKNISEVNKKAIKQAQSKGAIVCLCTGRQIDITKKFKEIAGTDKYVIASNGAIIYDCERNEELFSLKLADDICKKVYEYSIGKNILLRFDTRYARYLNDINRAVTTEIELEEDFDEFLNKNTVLQISVCSPNLEYIDEIIDYIEKNRSDVKIENKFIAPIKDEKLWAINIINSSVSKGNAINGLCKFLKIDTNDVIAMGDDLNDISMMKTVGLGVAMGNAKEEVKKHAKEITKTNNENGVAELINKKAGK